ncbi:MAG: response regulator [Anaerolineales bacterium]|nr:response regulator [Anaerolineales bacterium]
MSYKVFFVEDEVITREGIRDNIDWQANGFVFCGEATDGEMALPLLRTTQPDVLLTDIKMPFMDGLQLSKIVRERMPWVKIIILSGHDEFEYAQRAIHLGVTDYLLKPVTVNKLQNALQTLKTQLDQEQLEQNNLKNLQVQAAENRATLRERLLFKLVIGAVSPVEAIEKGQILGIDLSARYYLVMILKAELVDRTEKYDYDEFQQFQQVIVELAAKNPDIFLLKRDWGETIIIMKGSTPEYLEEERDILLEEIQQVTQKTRYQLMIGIGATKKRIVDICQSYVEALATLSDSGETQQNQSPQFIECDEWLKVDKSAIENYLRYGIKEDFDLFYNAYLQPLGETALKSNLIKNYIFVDLILSVANLAHDMGGEIDKIIPELNSIEAVMTHIKSEGQLREQVYKILARALAFRDSRCNSQYRNLIHQAKQYLECNYTNSDLSLNEVASQVNLSASHFSVIFSQEAGQTFKEYLTELRINKARELLRMTALRSAEIAYQVGYNDPHYFSFVFKKNTGFSPIEFRSKN